MGGYGGEGSEGDSGIFSFGTGAGRWRDEKKGAPLLVSDGAQSSRAARCEISRGRQIRNGNYRGTRGKRTGDLMNGTRSEDLARLGPLANTCSVRKVSAPGIRQDTISGGRSGRNVLLSTLRCRGRIDDSPARMAVRRPFRFRPPSLYRDGLPANGDLIFRSDCLFFLRVSRRCWITGRREFVLATTVRKTKRRKESAGA